MGLSKLPFVSSLQSRCVFQGGWPNAYSKEGDPGHVLQIQNWDTEMLSLWTTSKLPCGYCFSPLPLPCGSGASLIVCHPWVRSHVMLGLALEASGSFRSSFHSFLWVCCVLWGPGHCVWWFKKVTWREQVSNDGSIRRRRPWMIAWLAKKDLGALGDGLVKIPWQKLEGCSCVIMVKY